mgnify:CR=1 FL=1
MEDKHISYSRIGDLDIQLTSEMINGKRMDTKIVANGGTLCFVAGEAIDAFLTELNEIISKYRI